MFLCASGASVQRSGTCPQLAAVLHQSSNSFWPRLSDPGHKLLKGLKDARAILGCRAENWTCPDQHPLTNRPGCVSRTTWETRRRPSFCFHLLTPSLILKGLFIFSVARLTEPIPLTLPNWIPAPSPPTPSRRASEASVMLRGTTRGFSNSCGVLGVLVLFSVTRSYERSKGRKDATNGAPGLTTRSKKLLGWRPSLLGWRPVLLVTRSYERRYSVGGQRKSNTPTPGPAG